MRSTATVGSATPTPCAPWPSEEVVETAEATGIGLRIRLPSGTVVLHPEWDELVGPEIASYRTRGFADWTVWRPGEDSFEDLA